MTGTRHTDLGASLAGRLGWFRRNRFALGTIVAVDVGGIAYGYAYYADQLRATPWHLAPFVPDSPNAVLLFLVALLLLLRGRRQPWLEALGSVSLVKVGLWTLFVLLYHGDVFLAGPQRDFRLVLLALHVAMMFQPVMLADTMRRVPPWQWAAILAWFLANDAIDYALGVHPWIPYRGIGLVATVTAALSLACTAGLASLWSRASDDGSPAGRPVGSGSRRVQRSQEQL